MKQHIITFDGEGGAGETTQERLLSKKFLVVPSHRCNSLKTRQKLLLHEKTGKDFFVSMDWCYLPLIKKYSLDAIDNHLSEWSQRHPDFAGCEPSISFWIDVPLNIAMKRRASREGLLYEEKDWHFDYDKKIPKYLAKLKKLLSNFYVIDGLQSPNAIHQQIMGFMKKHGFIHTL